MSTDATDPTSYPDVNAVLHEVLARVQTILGLQVVGMYLYGSLASGHFDPQRSDIDFLVVTTDELSDELLPALAAMHAEIAVGSSPWATRLEGPFLPRRALRRYDPAHARHPSIGVGQPFGVRHHHSDWVIQRHLIREQGVALAGPHPRTLIDPVGPDDLRQAVRAILREWWLPKMQDPAWVHDREYQAFAVLTMCRALYTLHEGTVVSKPVAADWAQVALGERWVGLIQRALRWRPDDPSVDMDDTLALIGYAIKCSECLGATDR
ncbi:MAG: DUF4111 domain-containing protein [Chloroflexota bacterium]|nr:DUF4111 domain-containing protein [Chloroflexota bacterium]